MKIVYKLILLEMNVVYSKTEPREMDSALRIYQGVELSVKFEGAVMELWGLRSGMVLKIFIDGQLWEKQGEIGK